MVERKMTLIKYKNGVQVRGCTPIQRIHIELELQLNFFPYVKFIQQVNEKFGIRITDLGQLTKKQAREALKKLREGEIRK